METSIRSATKEDISRLRSILQETDLYFAPIDDYPEWYEQQIENDSGSIVVAEREGEVVGMILYVFSPMLSMIAHLAVVPEHQYSGIGTLLVREAITRISKHGGHYVAAYIAHDNEASLALFKSLGSEEYPIPLTAVFYSI